MLETIPQTITGPATKNILAHVPKIIPSVLYSIALEQMLFAKPVIGTIVPAPANFAMLSKMPNAVKTQVIKISTIKVHAPNSVSVIAGKINCIISLIAWPKQQISPPIANAKKSDGQSFVCGDFALTYALYLLSLSALSIIFSNLLCKNIANICQKNTEKNQMNK